MVIPYQVNDGGIVALLPDGRTEFFHPAVHPHLQRINHGELDPHDVDFDSFVLDAPRVDLDNFHLRAPVIAFIETTNLCNLRCKHCYASSGRRRRNEMSTETILRLLDTFAEIGVLQIFLTGGEVFSHPDVIEIIQRARSHPYSTQIFTNGLLITDDHLRRLPPKTSFFISFDTAVPTRTIRGGMDFPKLRRLFDDMDRYGHLFRTAVSVHRYNIDDIEEIFDWCVRHGYPRPQWLETHPLGRALLHPDMLLQPEHVDEVFEIYQRCMERYTHDVDAAAADEYAGSDGPRDIQSIQTVKFCQRLERATRREKCARSIVYVNSAGDVFPCSNCMSAKMYAGGNLRDHDFTQIWSDGFDDVRSITFDDHELCTTCDVDRAGIACQFRCPPLATNLQGRATGCGATDYVRLFMLKVDEYFRQRKERNVKLALVNGSGAGGTPVELIARPDRARAGLPT